MLALKKILNVLVHKIRLLFSHASLRLSRVELEVLALIVLALFSPWWGIDRTLPWQKIWGTQVSWADRYRVVQLIDQKQESTISVMAYGEPIAALIPSEVGVTYDVEALFRTLYADETPIDRIAGSLDNVAEVPTIVFDETLDFHVDAIAAIVDKPAVDARLNYTDGVAQITPEQSGQKVEKSQLKSAIVAGIAQAKSAIDTPLTIASPNITASDLQKKLEQLERLHLREPLQITIASETYTMNADVLISLLDNEKINTPEQLQLSKTKVQDYVKNIIAPHVATAGEPQRIITVDGVIEQTINGVDGRVLDEEALVADILNAFLDNKTKLKGSTVTASAGVVAEKRYSRSAAGLNFLLADWDKETAGEWGVYVKDASNSSVEATLHPDKSFVTASIYKLYVAAYVYSEIEHGTASPDDATALSKSVNECMRVMIVISDNSCPSYFFDHFGYRQVQQYVQTNGYSATDVDNSAGGDKYTTARDTMKLLSDISTTLLSDVSEQQLMSYMSQQIYRSGIPKGANTKPVADKVGFLYGYNHDVGYVGGDKPYTLVILSNGSNFSAVAELTKRIDTVMSK